MIVQKPSHPIAQQPKLSCLETTTKKMIVDFVIMNLLNVFYLTRLRWVEESSELKYSIRLFHKMKFLAQIKNYSLKVLKSRQTQI